MALPALSTWRWYLLAAALLLVPLCTFQVRTTEHAIKTTFSVYDPAHIAPGLHFKWPWPIQRVFKVENSLQVLEARPDTCVTHDEKTLVISFFAAWHVEQPKQYFDSYATLADAAKVLGDLISTTKTGVINHHDLKDLVSVAPPPKLATIEKEILDEVNLRLAAGNYGIKVDSIGIQQLNLPEQLTPDVFNRMREQRTLVAKGIRADGQQEAASITTKASEERQKKLDDARAEARKLRGEGDAAAAKAYERFNQDPEFALFLRRLEALENTVDDKTTIVIDSAVRPFDLLRGDHPPPPPGTASPATPAAPAAKPAGAKE